MIVVLSKDATPHDKEIVRIFLKDRGFSTREQTFGDDAIIGATGKGVVDIRELSLLPGVERASK